MLDEVTGLLGERFFEEKVLPMRRRYFYLGLSMVTALSFGLRFWQLGRFDALVFDEVYYATFAQGYLRGEALFDAHPPLGKYAIALGIWLHTHLASSLSGIPFGPFANELTLNPVSYRWMNAFVGGLIPLLVVWIGWILTRELRSHRSQWFALLSGVFISVDGLFVTESRYALINIYVVFFGLLGHGLWMWAHTIVSQEQKQRKAIFYLLSGIALGTAVAVKWNGLGYLLSLMVWESWRMRDVWIGKSFSKSFIQGISVRSLASSRFLGKSVLFYGLWLGLVPTTTYCLLWWPYLALSDFSFLGLHYTILSFHQGLDTFQVTCSRWFTWPLLIKPMAYGYVDAGTQVFTVNNLGNPALWWLSGAAVFLVGIERLMSLKARFPYSQTRGEDDEIKAYLLIGYLANWLPWVMTDRCTYIYLFMPAVVYGFMLLAWLLSGWLAVEAFAASRWMGFVMLSAIALSFFFWLPLSLGLPLTPEQLQLRWWLPSWI
ncbi:MAG: phospholipid carrier-dependent glycosyltransferase [Cyanobacteria bacterium J06621_11]